ncbi:ABC transporter ATP-binding protein [Shinella sumterensis]|uniref:ABC transporter ATP-binding protein n=1 Tax=Shinella sumterensis TaxID=1967501 RepID=UPI00106DDBA8|nr:ABC transporter ATP-binding protein [Shinella sumterensis]MCD1265411.1 ATP-binding cassette domain-containing protein [Shinella sumterensis]TFE93231.1 ABC transporter ATP-binding protein [Shinella sumterensis]
MRDVQPHLRLSGVQGWYGESHVLHGVDLSIMPGETLMLTGRNGAGKTTTLKAIAALLKKRTGAIEINGRDVTSIPRHRLAYQGLAYVPEERGIFSSLTVEENLLLPVVVAEGGMMIEEIYTLFPNLKERRTSPGTKLSGGEQQMLAMARVLRTGAKLLLLDEPTEGLAPVIVDRIAETLQILKQRRMTILLVEQNFGFSKGLADRLCVMEHGRIVLDLAAADIDARRGELEGYLGV